GRGVPPRDSDHPPAQPGRSGRLRRPGLCAAPGAPAAGARARRRAADRPPAPGDGAARGGGPPSPRRPRRDHAPARPGAGLPAAGPAAAAARGLRAAQGGDVPARPDGGARALRTTRRSLGRRRPSRHGAVAAAAPAPRARGPRDRRPLLLRDALRLAAPGAARGLRRRDARPRANSAPRVGAPTKLCGSRRAPARGGDPVSGDLIDTTEMYLKTVLELHEACIAAMRARIAERLGHSGPTVSQTVARMERDGLLYLDDQRRIRLTAEGSEVATDVMRKHRLAERHLLD